MKKFLSIILAILFVFSHCNANCYEITDLPDGNKKVTIKYDDLDTVIEGYSKEAQFYETPMKLSIDLADNVAPVLAFSLIAMGVLAIGGGIYNKIKKDGHNFKPMLLVGTVLIALNFLTMGGCHKLCDCVCDKLRPYANEIHAKQIDTILTKALIDPLVWLYVTDPLAWPRIVQQHPGISFNSLFDSAANIQNIDANTKERARTILNTAKEESQKRKQNFQKDFYINKKGYVYKEHYTNPVSGETTIRELSNEEQYKLPFKIE